MLNLLLQLIAQFIQFIKSADTHYSLAHSVMSVIDELADVFEFHGLKLYVAEAVIPAPVAANSIWSRGKYVLVARKVRHQVVKPGVQLGPLASRHFVDTIDARIWL